MLSHLQKPMLIILIFAFGITSRAQTIAVPDATKDSLQQLLTYFYENAKADTLKKTVTLVKDSFKGDSIDVALASSLLTIENLVLRQPALNHEKIFSYAVMLDHAMRQLYPGREHRDYAASLNNLARMYHTKGKYDRALELYHEALAIRKKVFGEESIHCAITLNNIAFAYVFTGMNDKGLACGQQALAILKKIVGEEHMEYSTSLSVLASIHINLGQYANALPLLQQAIAIAKKKVGTENDTYTSYVNNLVVLYENMGEYEKALTWNMEVLAIRKRLYGEESPIYSYSVVTLGNLYKRLGEFEKALPLHQQALAIRKKALGVNHPSYAISLINLAGLYVEMGQYHNAMPLDQEAIVVARKVFGEGHTTYGSILNNLAQLYENLGEYEKAMPVYQESVAVFSKALGKEHPSYAQSISNMGLAYQNQGKYEEAKPLLEEVVAIRKKVLGEENPEYAYSLNALANLYADMGNYQKALPLILNALDITKKVQGEDNHNYASVLHTLAFVYENLKQYDQALSCYQQALAIRKKVLGDKHPDYISNMSSMGLYHVLSGDMNKARRVLIDANNIELDHLARTYSSLAEEEKIKYLNKETHHFHYLPSLMITQGEWHLSMVQQVYTNEIALKGMVLENQKQILHAIRQSGDSSDLLLYNQWRYSKKNLGKQYLLPLNERAPDLDSLEEISNQLEQQLSRRFANVRNELQPYILTAKDISGKLQKGQAAVEFLQFKLYNKRWSDSSLYAAMLILPGDSNISFVPLFEERQLQRLLDFSAYRSNTNAAIRKLYPGTGISRGQSGKTTDSLYLMIWKPLEKYLQGVHTVFYAPAGLLHRIPFQALRPDATHLLMDKYNLRVSLSTRSVALPVQAFQKPGSIGLWGNIAYNFQNGTNTNISSRGTTTDQPGIDTAMSSFNFYTSDTRQSRGGEWRTLPGTKKEMINIRSAFSHSGVKLSIDSGKLATEEAFKSLDGKSPKVLHLATHGFFLPFTTPKENNNYQFNPEGNAFTMQQNPMFRSGLVLSGGNHAWKGKAVMAGSEDGILTAYEIAQMDLSNTDLVVLSACETALGDIQGNEGVIGLQRAFKMAGVKQMIVSLWRIPDKETTELMTMFYRNWLNGQSTREALRSAQMKMKEKYPPYYWAAFVLIE